VKYRYFIISMGPSPISKNAKAVASPKEAEKVEYKMPIPHLTRK